MGTEDWVLKGTKFDNKYQKAKIKNLEYWLDSQKYDIKKKYKVTKIIIYIYIYIYIYMKFALKIRSFFCKVIGYKNEN